MGVLDFNRLELALLRRVPVQHRHFIRKFIYRSCYGYENIADPHKIIWVDPKEIKYVTTYDSNVDESLGRSISESITYDLDRGRFSKARIGSIKGGNWDSKDTRFDDLYLPQAVEAHYEDDIPWEETEFFHRYKQYLSAGNQAYGVSTYSEFRNTFPEYINDLYTSMKSHGYRTDKLSPDVSLENKGTKKESSIKNEIFKHISINIGRDGEFLFNNSEGHHRLSLARILDIDAVPVVVIVRHQKWQKVRDQYSKTDQKSPNLIHEDLLSDD